MGLAALPSQPRLEFRTFAKGWAAGAAKGGAIGMVSGLVEAMVEAARNPATGPYGPAATLIGAAVLTTVNTTLYALQGGASAVPSETARHIEQQLEVALGGAGLSEDLANGIYALAMSRPELRGYGLNRLDVPQAAGALAYDELSHQAIDTVVEVRITEVGFRGGSGSRPEVNFYLNATIRLLSMGTGSELYARDFQYLSRGRPFQGWFVDGAGALVAAFGQARASLAERILDELFTVTRFPFDSGLWAVPGQPGFGACWFRPEYPELKYTSLWHSIRHNAPGIQVLYPEVDSLQPLLRWEPFPRPRDRKPANAAILKGIGGVTYDLKLWEAFDGYPERLIEDVSGLAEPRYRPGFPLKPASQYFWTVRARYQLDGQPQVSRWAFSSIPSNVPLEYPLRPPGGTCDLDAIPPSNYFRFRTP